MTDVVPCGNCGNSTERHCVESTCSWWTCEECGCWGDGARRRMVIPSKRGEAKTYDVVEYDDGQQ